MAAGLLLQSLKPKPHGRKKPVDVEEAGIHRRRYRGSKQASRKERSIGKHQGSRRRRRRRRRRSHWFRV
jgi:hypothetical protein